MATCEKCKNQIAERRLMNCFVCKKHFHLPCANVTSPRFYLMSPSKKQTWKCDDCWEQHYKKDKDVITNTSNFVTQRKYRINISTCNSFDSLSDEESSNLSASTQKLNRSCPEVKINHGDQAEDLEEKNFKLQLELESADEEIKNLLSENFALKNRITKLESANKTLTKICSSPKKMSKNIQRKPLKKRVLEFSNIDHSTTEQVENRKNDQTLSSPEACSPTNISNNSDTKNENKDYTLINYNKESQKFKASDNLTDEKDNLKEKRKLCLISSNSRNKILQLTRSTIDHTDICHYITPRSKVSQLLKGIDKKLYEFDLNDYCIIFIGDSDFKQTYRYSELITEIRNTLLSVQHTNIIVCLPTYKSANYANLYNKRVEIFNNLLYRDNKCYKYAFLLDSNEKLEYSTEMYTTRGGFVSNYGYRVIVGTLKELICDITHNYYLNSLNELLLKVTNNTALPQNLNQHCTLKNDDFFRP